MLAQPSTRPKASCCRLRNPETAPRRNLGTLGFPVHQHSGVPWFISWCELGFATIRSMKRGPEPMVSFPVVGGLKVFRGGKPPTRTPNHGNPGGWVTEVR